MTDKKLSARAEKEIRDLQATSGEGRATGEQRGGVKKTETRVAGLAGKLEEQAKVAAAKRQAEMQKTRQMHTPKSGSKSAGASPTGRLAELGYKGGEEQETEKKAEESGLGPRVLEMDDMDLDIDAHAPKELQVVRAGGTVGR